MVWLAKKLTSALSFLRSIFLLFSFKLKSGWGGGNIYGPWELYLLNITIIYFFLWRCDPTRVMASSFLRFLDHTQGRTTVGRTPLDEWLARRRDLYLTTHNTHNRQHIYALGGIRTHDLSRRSATDLRLRLHGHWDRRYHNYGAWKFDVTYRFLESLFFLELSCWNLRQSILTTAGIPFSAQNVYKCAPSNISTLEVTFQIQV